MFGLVTAVYELEVKEWYLVALSRGQAGTPVVYERNI